MTEAAIVQEPVVVAPVEHVYKYQPRDDNGQPIGGEQVIKYDGTPEDLGAKMAAQNTELVKLSRRLKKDLRLGNITTEQIPDTAPKFDESKFQLTPQPLTAEERIQLAADINDPEKFDSVSQRLIRASIGDPEALRTRLARLEQQAAKSNALEEATAFRNANPDYFVCPENFKTLANWIIKNGLEPVQENFQLAYDTLKEYMIERPQAAPIVAPVVHKTEEPITNGQPSGQPVARPVSSGLTRSNGSDSGPAPKTGFSQAEIDKMSAEEYRVKVLVPEFKAKNQRA